MLMHGHGLRSKKVQSALDFFRHYLTARQLNDDVHDWQDDLEAGRITPATDLIFEIWRKRYPRVKIINLGESLPQLREIFWEDAIPALCAKIISHSDTATGHLRNLSLLEPDYFIALVERQKSAAEKALKERAFVKEFTNTIPIPTLISKQ